MDQQTWDQFMAWWAIFKTTMGVDGGTASMWFFNYLEKDLGDEVLKANPGTPPQNITKDDLVACTKKLAVKIKMGQAIQPPGTGVNPCQPQGHG